MKKMLLLVAIATMLASCAQKPAQTVGDAANHASAYTVTRPGDEDSLLRIPGGNVYTLNKYLPAERNIATLTQAVSDDVALKRVVFAHSKNETNVLKCRAFHLIYGSSKKPFSYLIESAINQELKASGRMGSKRYRVHASLDEMNFSTLDYKLFGTGKWIMQATLRERGKEPLVIRYEHAFPLAIMAEKTCTNAAESMLPAIQSFLYAMYTNPRFGEFVHYTKCAHCGARPATQYIQRKRSVKRDSVLAGTEK